jgi:hypothetical protein
MRPQLPPPPQVASVDFEHLPVEMAIVELAEDAELTAVIDPNASQFARCARITIVVPRPRPVAEVVGLVAEALRPSGFVLSREPGGLMLRHDGSSTPPGCEDQLAGGLPLPSDSDSDVDATEDDTPPPSAEDLDRAIRAVSDTEYLILDDATDELFGEQSLMRSARIIPNLEDGEPHGFKVYGIRPTSVAGRLGIHNGDTILTVNGREINGPDTAMEVYASSRGANRVEVEIDRRGEHRTHVYRVVQRLPRR